MTLPGWCPREGELGDCVWFSVVPDDGTSVVVLDGFQSFHRRYNVPAFDGLKRSDSLRF